MTYDNAERGSYRHLWRKSDTEYEYKFFHANDYGIDANTSFAVSNFFTFENESTITKIKDLFDHIFLDV